MKNVGKDSGNVSHQGNSQMKVAWGAQEGISTSVSIAAQNGISRSKSISKSISKSMSNGTSVSNGISVSNDVQGGMLSCPQSGMNKFAALL